MFRKIKNTSISFFIIVIIPTFISIVYNLFLATPTYISEAKVIVKSLGSGEMPGGLGSLLSAVGVLHPSTSGAYLVMEHIRSRDVMFQLEEKYKIKEYYSSKDWDILRRFDPLGIDPSYENFYEYYKDRVIESFLDTNSGVITIRIRGKDPEYPTTVLREILGISENFVNGLNMRASMTALNYYKEQLEKSRAKVKEYSEKLKKFLNENRVFAPDKEVAVLLSTIAELQKTLIAKQIELSNIESVAPDNPKIPQLRKEIEELRNKINALLSKITGRSDSLATSSVELELLKTELLMLQKEVEMNLAAYLHAQNQAYLQHLFIETVEAPIKPDAPREPRALKNIFVVFILSFITWAIIWLLTSAAREHVES